MSYTQEIYNISIKKVNNVIKLNEIERLKKTLI